MGRAIALALVTMVPIVACGGSGDDDEDAGAAVGGAVAESEGGDGGGEGGDGADAAEDTEGGSGDDDAGSTSVTLDETVYFEGFAFQVQGAELAPPDDTEIAPEEGIAHVTVDLTVENPSATNAVPDASLIHLEHDGVTVGSYTSIDVTEVPSGAKSAAKLVVEDVPDDTPLDEVELVFGGTDLHQARVPFGDTGEIVTLAPLDITYGEPGRGEGSEIELAVEGGQVMYGNPDDMEALAAETVLLVVDLKATTTAESRSTSVAVLSSDLRVTLADGTSVGPDPGSITDFGDVLYPSESTTGAAGFEIPADTSGDVKVSLVGQYSAEGFSGDTVESAVTVTLPEA